MVDGRHLEIIEISHYLRNRLTDFYEICHDQGIWYSGTSTHNRLLKFSDFEIQEGGSMNGRHLEKSKN